MKNLIEFQKEIKEWDIEKILDKLVSEGYWHRVTSNEEIKKEHEGKILLLKMEVVSRTN